MWWFYRRKKVVVAEYTGMGQLKLKNKTWIKLHRKPFFFAGICLFHIHFFFSRVCVAWLKWINFPLHTHTAQHISCRFAHILRKLFEQPHRSKLILIRVITNSLPAWAHSNGVSRIILLLRCNFSTCVVAGKKWQTKMSHVKLRTFGKEG